jgi:4-amino-4-deoxy-L-arabinose transferase-like glycosyltransferase
LPAALLGLVAGLWFTARMPRTGKVRASLLLWGGWLLVSAGVFSFMTGVIHPYYTVALAPAIAALVGISVRELWRGREYRSARMVLACMLAATGVWAVILLDRTPAWLPALRWVIFAGTVIVAAVVAVGAHRVGRATLAAAVAALLLGVAAPAAYTVDTVIKPHSGPIPSSGPASTGFGPGGPDAHSRDNPQLRALVRGAADTRWAAAAVGSMTTNGLSLSTGASVMAIGGFTGGDNSPTLQQFQKYVADRQIHYFIAGGMDGPRGGRPGAAKDIAEWVQQNFLHTDVGGATVYDLFAPTS